ncbi:MAG: hypothetical protein RR399_03755, partial [Lachnospiraceae bacterium]
MKQPKVLVIGGGASG